MALKILQWNIRGYINNYNELLLVISTHKPQIIALQETHINEKRNIPIPLNYTLIQKNRQTNSYGGVGILVQSSIQHDKLDFDNNIEIVGITIYSKIKLYIASVYIKNNLTFRTKKL